MDIPDYHFYSNNALDDAKQLADIIIKRVFLDGTGTTVFIFFESQNLSN